MRNVIKELRESRGVSQEYLGNELGVSRQTVIAIEKGKYNPSLELAFKMRELFQMDIENMFYPN